MKKLHEDISVTDPNIANQIFQSKKQINDRLKRIGQIQTEIVTYQQQIAALEDQAIKTQQAQVIAKDDASQKLQKTQADLTDTLQTEKLMPSLSDFMNEYGEYPILSSSENYDEIDEEDDEEYDEDSLDISDDEIGEDPDEVFFVRMPSQEEDDKEIIAKVFKVEEDSKWYVRDIEDEVDWLEDLVFGEEYDKVEIISYLADILGDVQEIDRDEYDIEIDDKAELDDKYFPEE